MSMSDIKISKTTFSLERETQLPFEQLTCSNIQSNKDVECDEVNKEHKSTVMYDSQGNLYQVKLTDNFTAKA